jgi:hypothetical protein
VNAKYILLLCFLFSCKQTGVTKKDESRGRRQFSSFYATGATEMRGKSNFYYKIFKRDYELLFSSIPTSGSVDQANIPYVGGWHPHKTGGTSRDNGTGNVLQKYDKAFNLGENRAQKWEDTNHKVSPSAPAAEWSGHCNGFSASAQRHREPFKSVVRGDVTFSPKDIKTLLAEIHMSAKFYFLGGSRCSRPGPGPLPSPLSRNDARSLDECDDVNPATFHTALGNWIGIQKHTIIADLYARDQVWNYPHYKYESTSQSVTAAAAMSLITGEQTSEYRFNPEAVSFRRVTTSTHSSRAFEVESMTAEVALSQRTEVKTYQYILELDAGGRIIGGEWIGASQQDHPDFLWVALEPLRGDGSPFAANPHVDPKEVIKLWAQSIDADPNAPPLDILEPVGSTSWGKFPKFSMTINQSNSGSVFLGRAQNLRLTRQPPLHGDLKVGLVLDGVSIGEKNISAADDFEITLPAFTRGIHSIDVTWSKSGTQVDRQRSHFLAL